MADYLYLLENRLSPEQQDALRIIRDAAREASMTIFLTGGAVRDLTSGSPVRDLDVTVQGDALTLRQPLEQAGGIFQGEHADAHAEYFKFPGGVRVEIVAAHTVAFPTPGKPDYHAAAILEDLRQRDFTANSMALSLNDGSYGLLMDPLNGLADIESRQLRLVSNYGFIEDPSRLVRAARLTARMSWEMDEKTRERYQTAKQEGYISAISQFQKGYELEEIAHEEDGLRILKALEDEGWMAHLYPAWTTAKANTNALTSLHEVLTQLQMQGINPDTSAASIELLTAKMSDKEIAGLKKLFPRQGFVREWEALDTSAKELAKQLTAKDVASPSASWKLLTTAPPEAVLWLAHTTQSQAVKTKFNNFFTVWPEARQRIPYSVLQEMRIVPDLPGYQDLLKTLFFEFMDGRLTTEEEIRKFLEPYSPPAPPPPVSLRKPRAVKKAEQKKGRGRAKAQQPVVAAAQELAPEVAGTLDAVAARGGAAEISKPAVEKSRSRKAKSAAKPLKTQAARASKASAPSASSAPVQAAATKGLGAPPKRKKAVRKVTSAMKKAALRKVAEPAAKKAAASRSQSAKAAAKPAKRAAAKPALKKVAKKATAVRTTAKKAVRKKGR